MLELTQIELIFLVVLVLIFGGGLGALLLRWDVFKSSSKNHNHEEVELKIQLSGLAAKLEAKHVEVGRLEAVELKLTSRLDELQNKHVDLKKEMVALSARSEQNDKHADEKIELLKNSEKKLSTEFENLANKIFEEKSKKFADQNQQSIGVLLNPLKSDLKDFKKRVEDVYDKETKDRVSLQKEITLLRDLNVQINREATNLTKALKGDSKTQGNWGEMILEKVLEESGLRNGYEYQTQASYSNESGERLRPDVIVHLPENKDIVVDAKVSLTAYEQFCSLEDDADKEQALKAHTLSVKKHIRELSEKDYENLKGIRSLDFVLMFVPIEAAFMVAVQADSELFSTAFQKKIIVVSPTTLLATLRTIHNIWRYENQNKNAQKIADKAGAIYDKFRGFVEDMERLGKNLDQTQKSYKSAFEKLSDGRGSLVKQAQGFIDLGVKVKKELPQTVLDGIESDR